MLHLSRSDLRNNALVASFVGVVIIVFGAMVHAAPYSTMFGAVWLVVGWLFWLGYRHKVKTDRRRAAEAQKAQFRP